MAAVCHARVVSLHKMSKYVWLHFVDGLVCCSLIGGGKKEESVSD